LRVKLRAFFSFFSAITVDFEAAFFTHQLTVNEDTRALAHFSYIEKCVNASAKLNRVNIVREKVASKSTFVLHYTRPMHESTADR
jgi:hypothetical protein